MTVEVICGELRTGRILTTVSAAAAGWSVQLNDAGTVTTDVPLSSLAPADAAELVGYLDPARCYLAVRVGDAIVEAGPIWRHDYQHDDGTLKVTAAGLWSVFDHRKVMKVLTAGESAAGSVVAFSGLSLGTIAKRLVEKAAEHTGGDLPVIHQDDDTGDHDRTYPGYSLKGVGDALRDLTGVIDGPDIDFAPRLTTDRAGIEWVMRTGTTTDPLLYQSGDDWSWDTTVPKSGLSGLSVTRDATDLGYRAWVPGSGMEAAMPIGQAENLDPVEVDGFPLLEVTESRSSTQTAAVLDAHAEALLERSTRPWVTWAWETDTDTPPALGEYRPGDWAQVNVPTDHPYLAALGIHGRYRTRIVGFSGDLGQVVKITAAPTLEAR